MDVYGVVDCRSDVVAECVACGASCCATTYVLIYIILFYFIFLFYSFVSILYLLNNWNFVNFIFSINIQFNTIINNNSKIKPISTHLFQSKQTLNEKSRQLPTTHRCQTCAAAPTPVVHHTAYTRISFHLSENDWNLVFFVLDVTCCYYGDARSFKAFVRLGIVSGARWRIVW